MKKRRIVFSAAAIVLAGLLGGRSAATAQGVGGDQFLDGIGETALISRYVFNGNTEDRSRNNHHAALRGDGAAYVEDERFGKVLALSGEGGAHLTLPAEALTGVDSISVVGWLLIRSGAPWQRFFDLGTGSTANFFCTPVGRERNEGYRSRITASGWEEEQGPIARRVATHRWVHLAVVLDAAKQTLSIYSDGGRVGRATNVTLNLEQVLGQEDGSSNRLYIGRSQYETDPTLNALLHDVRLYSVALTDQQVAVICSNALSGDPAVASREERAGETRPEGPVTAVSLSESLGLVALPEIQVETSVGHLPRLPRHLPSVYRNGRSVPRVRVIWSSPTNNSPVLEAGNYTVNGVVPGTDLQASAVVTVKAGASQTPVPRLNLEPFPLGQVVLERDQQERDTKFIENRDKFILGLAKTSPDRFLYMFRDAFGQEQPEGARPLRGWDDQTTRLRGHASGHYLTAIAQAYAGTTYEEELQANFMQKMNYMIDVLHDLSRRSGRPAQPGGLFNDDPATVPPGPGREGYDSDLSEAGIRTDYWNWGRGFISAYPPDQFIMLEKGSTYGGRNSQIWAPYYTLHKILAGLLDCYEFGGNAKAREIAEGMGLWVYERLKVVPVDTRISMWNRYIAGEYGGMNEVMARLFRITKDQRFLECARLFDNIEFFFGDVEHSHGLAHNVDTLRGKHANQHIPQITGALETYRGTQESSYYHVAENFWHICTGSYMYSIGGVAGAKNPNNAECFTAQPDTLFRNGFARGGQNETCATYNLLKLSRQLFLFDQDARYMDYYEQALYNHILASVDQDSPGNTYHVPLNPGARKRFGNANMSGFTCCNGTALESSTKLQGSIYFKGRDNQVLYVNLYVPSTLDWAERNVLVRQRTGFPYADTTQLTLVGGGTFDIKVRVPSWAKRGFFVKINGREQSVEAVPGTYWTLTREWKDDDVIELRMPFDFRLSPVMDQPNIVSLFYGPVLLAAQEPEPREAWRPVTLDADDLETSITGDPAKLRFRIGRAEFKPFFESYGRYSVYLDVKLK